MDSFIGVMDKINVFFFHWVIPFIPQKTHN